HRVQLRVAPRVPGPRPVRVQRRGAERGGTAHGQPRAHHRGHVRALGVSPLPVPYDADPPLRRGCWAGSQLPGPPICCRSRALRLSISIDCCVFCWVGASIPRAWPIPRDGRAPAARIAIPPLPWTLLIRVLRVSNTPPKRPGPAVRGAPPPDVTRREGIAFGS